MFEQFYRMVCYSCMTDVIGDIQVNRRDAESLENLSATS